MLRVWNWSTFSYTAVETSSYERSLESREPSPGTYLLLALPSVLPLYKQYLPIDGKVPHVHCGQYCLSLFTVQNDTKHWNDHFPLWTHVPQCPFLTKLYSSPRASRLSSAEPAGEIGPYSYHPNYNLWWWLHANVCTPFRWKSSCPGEILLNRPQGSQERSFHGLTVTNPCLYLSHVTSMKWLHHAKKKKCFW